MRHNLRPVNSKEDLKYFNLKIYNGEDSKFHHYEVAWNLLEK